MLLSLFQFHPSDDKTLQAGQLGQCKTYIWTIFGPVLDLPVGKIMLTVAA